MALPRNFMDDLRRRVRLSSIVGRGVKLTRAGNRMRGLCPFHNEKTPSFYVNDDEGFYKCFGCGVGGDAISYLQEKDGLGFMEAVRLLAGEAGMQVPDSGPPDPEASVKREARHAALDDAARFFESALATAMRDDNGGVAAYLKGRGMDDSAIREFRLGYAPQKGLVEAMQKAGHKTETLLEVGLARKSERDDSVYSYFRDRLMFPIADGRGKVIAFGGRALADDVQPKYINSPETPLFSKKSTLYAMHIARPVLRGEGARPLVVTEGYMDAIAVHASGVATSVAPLGTALTEEQIELLWRMHDEPLLCFDGDDAGRNAALKAILRALPILEPGKSLRLVLMPAGQDPDDVLRGEGGKAALTQLLGQSVGLVEGLWWGLAGKHDLADSAGRAAFWREIRESVRTIKNSAMRDALGDEVAGRIKAMRDDRKSGGGVIPVGWRIRRPRIPQGKRGMVILALLAGHPELIAENFEKLAGLTFGDKQADTLRRAFLNAVNVTPDLDMAGFRAYLEQHGLGHIEAETLLDDTLHHRLAYDPAGLDFETARVKLAEVMEIEARQRRKPRLADFRQGGDAGNRVAAGSS